MLKLLVLLLLLYIVAHVAHTLWRIGRRALTAGVFFLVAGMLFPFPIAGILFLVIGVAFLLLAA